MRARTAHILIEGRVQGVGFRYWMQQQAAMQGITGWVRNRRTGAVEAVLSGDGEAVAAMIEACRRGPPGARVDALYMVAEVTDGSIVVPATFELRETW